ncbi:MAG: PhoH family protein, partial [Betaproteobacteria bacterium]|nr:PhoH family protein [Betaproteobacteria bacterium]
MPLPPAPSKRADRLTAKDFEAPARASARPARKATPEVVLPQTAQVVQERPVARETKKSTQTPALTRAPATVTAQAPAPVAMPTKSVSKAVAPAPEAKRSKRAKTNGPKKLFVLDTNVLLHDPMCLFRFEEHDIYLPMIVLEELDGHKKGMTEVARNARQTSRTLDALAGTPGADITAGFMLDSTGHTDARGKLMFQTEPLNYTLPTSLPQGKADNQILGVVEALRQHYAPREVVLVSKDINMRVKARALGLATDDYQNDKTLEDGDLLYSGSLALPSDFWAT